MQHYFKESTLLNDEIRGLFPALKHHVYLNSAAVAPLPTVAIEAVNRQLHDVSEHGSSHYGEWVATKNRARVIVARMLGVRPEQVAFMRNTSDGFASVANGLKWNETDNIVSFEREFPANFYAWRMVRDRFGVELRSCPEREGRMDPDELTGLIDERTRLVSVSAVQFASGFRADLRKIGEAARAAGALFAVDIIQAFGALPLDLSADLVDIASGASHKWLCSPEGCGILYLSDRARGMVEPAMVGWISVENPWDFQDLQQPFKPNALAWESGTGASSLFYGLEQSLLLLEKAGQAEIASHLEDLTDLLCESIQGNGYKILSSRKPGEKSQIVSLEPTGGLASDEIFKRLEAESVVVSSRSGRLRVAPHFFNNRKDIERFVKLLP